MSIKTVFYKYRACTLGWCVEWLQSSIIVVDDVIDQAKTRRDKACWHLREEVYNHTF